MSPRVRSLLGRYAAAVGFALGAATLQWAMRPWVGPKVPFLFFLPAIVLAAGMAGAGPGCLVLLAGLVSAVLWLPPEGVFAVSSPSDVFSVGVYVVFALALVAFGGRMQRANQRAVSAEERLVLGVENTGIGLFDVDLVAGSVYLSPALARLVGLPDDGRPMPLRDCAARLPAQNVAESRAVLVQKFRERARHYERELSIAAPDGSLRWLMLRVHLAWEGERAVRLRGACVDITERKAVNAELQRTQAELKAQVADLQHLHELSSRLLDTPDLRVQLQLILNTLVEFHGAARGLVSLLDPVSNTLQVEASVGFGANGLARLAGVRGGEGACGLACALRERVVIADTDTDARFAYFRDLAREEGFRAVHSTPLVSQHGEVLGAVSVHFTSPYSPTERERWLADICARKAAVFIERARADAALQEADRRKDEFLATLAHELRNPLAPIRQAALLSQSPQATEAQKRWSHGVIDRQVQHMALLLDDLLDVSRITRGVLQLRKGPAELAAVVQAAVETARPLIDARRHQLTVALPPEPVGFEADPLRVAQVVANLLTNAAKYTDSGGQLRLWAGIERDEVVIEVSDNGIGIPQAFLPEVFRMFTQLHSAGERTGGGLGIGLALAKGLVELHGGRIEARSAGTGQGSTFTVRLPRGQAPSLAAPAPGGDLLRMAAVPRKVLIADDNRDAAESLAALLQLQGHHTCLAFDGEEALTAYRRFGPDVCLLDIGMPRRSGNEVAQAIREMAGGEGPVLVAITGWGQQRDRREALGAGFDHHLTKPVDPVRLSQLVAGPVPVRAA